MILGNTANEKNLLYYLHQYGRFFFLKTAEGGNMFTTLFIKDPVQAEPEHKEGDLYKVVNTFGRTFELKYGYYGDCDRRFEPDVIYPDFTQTPVYTDEGTPFVTMMQDACASYRGESKKTPDTTCAECKNFKRGEEWFGICTCEKNKKH